MYSVDPNILLKMIKQGQNPQQLLSQILEGQAGSNPVTANLLDLVKQNKKQNHQSQQKLHGPLPKRKLVVP